MSPARFPPPIIDSSRVLCYASIGDDLEYTDRIHLIVNGERLGRVPALAICRNYNKPDDILLLFCDAEWNSKGCIAFSSVHEAKLKAEGGYPGLMGCWIESPHDDQSIATFLREEYDVDPGSEWWRYLCSFCQKEVQGMGISKGWATICVSCVDSFYSDFHSDGPAGRHD